MTVYQKRKHKVNKEEIITKAKEFRIQCLESRWDVIEKEPNFKSFLITFLEWEDFEKKERKLTRLLQQTRLHKYRREMPMEDFDWSWPKEIDSKQELQELFNLSFIKEHENVVLIGANGLGKTTILKNLVNGAAVKGHSAIFIEAVELLDSLVSNHDRASRRRMLEKYSRCELLAIDEVGYLTYEAEHADLLFQLIQRRSGRNSTAISTNKDFSEWTTMFPNPASVTALVDRLIEKSTTVRIKGDSYRTEIQRRHMEKKSKRLKPKKALGAKTDNG